MKTALQLGGLALAVVLAVLAFRDLRWEDVAAAPGGLHWGWLAAGVAVFMGGYAVRIFRWRMMLRLFVPQARYRAIAGPFLAAFALNNVAPLRAGDVARSFAFREQVRAAPSQVTATLVLERLLDLMSLILLFAIGLMLLPLGSAWGDALTAALAPVLLLGVLVLGVPLFVPLRLARLLETIGRRMNWRAGSLPGRVIAFGRNALNSLAPFRRPALLMRLAALSLVAWLLEGAMFFAVARAMGLDGLGYGPMFSLAAATLATLIPSTPGYIGTFDYGGKLALMGFGAGDAQAALHILICHLIVWVVLTAAGGAYLLRAWGGGALARLRAMRRIQTGEEPR
ncbi:MAG: lysylphosphatidylglycerol synthase transmembrane domain-containing protein [Alphaproteobacteria bacterium]